jgi:hypothetical protein
LFGILDGLINANPFAVKLFEAYKPIAKTSANFVAGILIDLAYGFIMAGIFLVLYPGLPGATGLVKGLSFGLIAWFFRVAMYVVTQWMMFKVPAKTLGYILLTRLGEMLIIGFIYGIAL